MTPDEKRRYVEELKQRGQTAVERTDRLLTDLAVKSAKLKTDIKAMHNSLAEQLAEQATKG
ncbi:hypothetical protein ACFSUS_12060 [Spirosoma soli]|uniref:Uncharacterized protein n=1 Tax=Spirosoma soli TaxID=1770529 RepID=A0ABW5M2W3_9BACT